MGKAYLKYEQIAGFGVVSSSSAPVKQVRCSKSSTPFVASAAVDILTIWNGRTGESIARYGNAATRKAGAITALAVSAAGDTIACGYNDGSIRLWNFSTRDLSLNVNVANSEENEMPIVFSVHGNEPIPLVTFNGHRSGISALAFEDEGGEKGSNEERKSKSVSSKSTMPRTLVSGSNDGDIILWNVTESAGVFRINAHADAITSLALFIDNGNSYVVSGSKDTLIKVFDTETQHCIQTIASCTAEVWALYMEVSARLLFVGSVGAELRLFSLMSAEEQRMRRERDGKSHGVKQTNMTTMDDLLAYDNESIFKPLGSVERAVATDRVSTIESISHLGERYVVVCAADKTAEIFRLRDDGQALVHVRRREKRKIAAIEREVKGTGEDEGWNMSKIEETIREQQKDIKFEVEAMDYMISIRQIRMRKKMRSVSFLAAMTYIPSEREDNKAIELQLLIQLKDNALEIHSLTISGSKKARKRKNPSELQNDDDDNQKPVDEIKKLVALDFAGHRNDVRSVSLSPEESTLLSTSDGALKLWNVATQKCVRTMAFTGYGLCTQFVGADGMLGVVGTKRGAIEVYELGSGTLVTSEETAHEGEVWSMCLDDHIYDARHLVTGGADKRVCFWALENVLSGGSRYRRGSKSKSKPNDDEDDDEDDEDEMKLDLVRVLEMPDQVLCVRVAHQRKRPVVVISLMDSSVRAYFLDSLEPYLNFYGHRLPVMGMDISSDGALLATGSADKTVKIWGMDFGDCRRSIRAHSDSVLCIAFQPQTHYAFSGSRDGVCKYWDMDNFELICEMSGQRGEVWSLVTSLDGEVLASASHDRMIRVWRRTDEPLFLDEEKDRRLDDMFEAKLIDDDVHNASKTRKDDLAIFGGNNGTGEDDNEKRKNVGFMYNDGKAEATASGKQSIDTIKASETIMEAIELCDSEKAKLSEEETDDTLKKMNPLLLGMSPDNYMLSCLNRIRHADVEQTLHMVPLHIAIRLFDYLSILLDPQFRPAALTAEHLTRIGLFLVRVHHAQLCAGAVNRNTLARFHRAANERCGSIRRRFAANRAALHFVMNHLADRDDKPFRDARARVHNLQAEKKRRLQNSIV